MFCQKCGAPMPPIAAFCGKCGLSLRGSRPPNRMPPRTMGGASSDAPAKTWLKVVGIIGIIWCSFMILGSIMGVILYAAIDAFGGFAGFLLFPGLGIVRTNPLTMVGLYALDLMVYIFILIVSINMLRYRNDLLRSNQLFILGIICMSIIVFTCLIWAIAGPFSPSMMFFIFIGEMILPVLLFIGALRNRIAFLSR